METFVVSHPPKQQQVIVNEGKPLGYEQVAVSSTAIGITPPSGTRRAFIQCESNAIRYRDDGTDPDATTGMMLYPANVVQLTDLLSLTQFKAIRTGSADAKINVSYYG